MFELYGSYVTGTVSIATLQKRKLRPREGQKLSQVHTVSGPYCLATPYTPPPKVA